MTALSATVGTATLAGVAITLALFDHPRLAIAALAIAVLLDAHALWTRTRRPRP